MKSSRTSGWRRERSYISRAAPTHQSSLGSWAFPSRENLLVQVGWPESWGAVPDWSKTLRAYALRGAQPNEASLEHGVGIAPP